MKNFLSAVTAVALVIGLSVLAFQFMGRPEQRFSEMLDTVKGLSAGEVRAILGEPRKKWKAPNLDGYPDLSWTSPGYREIRGDVWFYNRGVRGGYLYFDAHHRVEAVEKVST